MPLAFTFDPHQVLNLADHAAHGRGVLERALAMALVEPETLQGRLLVGAPPDRAADLNDRDGLLVASHHAGSRASVSRRPRISATFLPRRAATARGLVTWPSAAKVALIMLCGFELPTDLATTSCTPSASKIARIGPPAMIPVPGFAALMMTLPAHRNRRCRDAACGPRA